MNSLAIQEFSYQTPLVRIDRDGGDLLDKIAAPLL